LQKTLDTARARQCLRLSCYFILKQKDTLSLNLHKCWVCSFRSILPLTLRSLTGCMQVCKYSRTQAQLEDACDELDIAFPWPHDNEALLCSRDDQRVVRVCIATRRQADYDSMLNRMNKTKCFKSMLPLRNDESLCAQPGSARITSPFRKIKRVASGQ
jgi:hypothetical protein